jgi:hypothetical protein
MAEEHLLRKSTRLICEGRYAAQVDIECWYDESWSPTMSIDDARKLERVRLALCRGDIAQAAKESQVFELTPVAIDRTWRLRAMQPLRSVPQVA